MNTKQRIEELERRVRKLEARPLNTPYPIYIPVPQYPQYPPPSYPWQVPYPTVWMSTKVWEGTSTTVPFYNGAQS